MTYPGLFFLVFVATIAISRLFLFAWPITSKTIWQRVFSREFLVHHYMYGVVLISASLFFTHHIILRVILFGAGFGLLLDQSPMFFRMNWTWDDYNSNWCRGTLILIIISIFFLRTVILKIAL